MDSLRSRKRRPTHPGEFLREDVLPALGVTQEQFAEQLGVSRLTISELLHEKRELSTDMALRLSKALDTSAESWLKMQTALNLWEARQSPSPALEAIKPFPRKRGTEVA